MENRLQQLTQKLYDEGLAKGREEAETLLAKAKAEAGSIIEEAKTKADGILKTAQDNAADLKKNTQTEILLASRQSIATIKQQIAELLIDLNVTPVLKDVLLDPALVKDLIVVVARNWNGSTCENPDLCVMLPPESEQKLVDSLKTTAAQTLGSGMEITTSEGVKSGFKIGPKDGSYYISFSDDDFDALFREFLRPKVSELLFIKK
ncbi:MAG: hypothetical protein LBU80_06770 [Rikenellaceae bacterium]|jgi:V/A-type H+-transporting ATPase subunit E|nr:hypothetical protein [Rikenellaceae bacterium]